MQADGLVMKIVKRFTEWLQQIKDIMELKGSTGPVSCASQHCTFMLMRNNTAPTSKTPLYPIPKFSVKGKGKRRTQ